MVKWVEWGLACNECSVYVLLLLLLLLVHFLLYHSVRIQKGAFVLMWTFRFHAVTLTLGWM